MRARKGSKTNVSYKPSTSLVDFMERRLQLEKRKDGPFNAGQDLDADYDRQKNNSDRMKVEILNTKIFPSMANLIYFLEMIAKSNELQKGFEDDLKSYFLLE